MNTNAATNCTCSVCGTKAISGKIHRRCGGSKDAKLRAKPSPADGPKNQHNRSTGRGPHLNAGKWS